MFYGATRTASAAFRARFASSDADLAKALALRARMFRANNKSDKDCFDARCQHVLIEDKTDGELAATLRLRVFGSGHEIADSYAAQFYDLTGIAARTCPMLELGRFCAAPGPANGDVLRLALAEIGRVVDDAQVGLIFGCLSFEGTDPAQYGAAFAMLNARHLGAERVAPRPMAGEWHWLRDVCAAPDDKLARQQMPGLLRCYLGLGGWVSDHVVIDRDLGTMHVFTGVEVSAVPEGRARGLRAMRI